MKQRVEPLSTSHGMWAVLWEWMEFCKKNFFHPTTNLEGKLSSWAGVAPCHMNSLSFIQILIPVQDTHISQKKRGRYYYYYRISIILVAILSLFLKQLVLDYSSFCFDFSFPSLNSHKNFILHVLFNTLAYCYHNSYYLQFNGSQTYTFNIDSS